MKTNELAKRVREDCLKMVGASGASHIGAILSVTDIVAVLYNDVLNVSKQKVLDENRDRFILSKGHAGAAVYATLAELGFVDKEDLLKNYYQNGAKYSGHISHKNIDGIEFSTGSLGHGACVACGIAKALKMKNNPAHVYVVVGDGECNEGSIWETAMFASQHKLDNFTIIVDKNNMQALGFTKDIINMDNMAERWKVFGFNVVETDGHDYEKMKVAFKSTCKGKPTVVIAHTTKGKGVSFMENALLWHYRNPSGELLEKALKEVND